MQPEPVLAAVPALEAVRARVEETLGSFLLARREEMAAVDPEATLLVDELRRLVAAGGKRIRPAFCFWGHRAAGGRDGGPIVRACAALELFHTFALIHDDVMDESPTRRGQPTIHARFAAQRAGGAGADGFGRSIAILAGDLAAVLADELFLDSGFPPERLLPALRRYGRMRTEVAAGQLLDVAGVAAASEARARRVASLKTGAYTVEGPLSIGAILAGGSLEVMAALSRFAGPLGEAFQLRDDVLDHGEGAVPGATSAQVNALVVRARDALTDPAVGAEAAAALGSLAGLLRLPEA